MSEKDKNELSVVCTHTTDRIRLSKQAKALLQYLYENDINGEIYSKDTSLEREPFPEIGTKLIDGKYVSFYGKGVSLIDYVALNCDKIPNHGLYVGSCTGKLSTHNLSLRNSLNRTILKWKLIERFCYSAFYGSKHYYFITLKGKQVFEAKLRRKQHIEAKP
jgi:hypothetical protein